MFFHVNQIEEKKSLLIFNATTKHKTNFSKKKKKVIFKISNVPKKCLLMKQTNQNRSSGYSNFN